MSRITVFLIGAIAGAGAALAFAPYSGEKMRALVAEKANAFAGEAKDFGAGLPESAKDAYRTARSQGVDMLKGAQSKTTGLVNDATGKGATPDSDELREKIEAARQRIAAQVMENAEKAKAAAGEAGAAVVEQVEAIEEKAEDVADEAADKAEDIADQVADKVEEIADKAEEVAEDATDKVEEVADEVADKVEEAADKADEVADEVADKVEELVDKAEEAKHAR